MINKTSSIFIAGHNGLVGSSVLKNLKDKGYKKIITITKKELDLKDTKKVEIFFKKKKIQYLINCAALAGGIVANQTYPVEFFNENILIQNSLLNLASKFKLKRTIFLGTSCIYPYKTKTPIKEEQLLTGKLHETNEAYAVAKIAGIELCKALYKQHNLDVVALMPTNVYGENDRYHNTNSHVIPGMILKFLEAKKKKLNKVELWGDGSPLREFLHADDLAEAIYKVLITSRKKLIKVCDNNFPILNIGSKDIYSIKMLAELIKKETQFKGKIFFNKSYPNGVMKKDLNFDRIRKLNWEPKFSLKNSLSSIIENQK
jgi:GDP-L-fucose synthase